MKLFGGTEKRREDAMGENDITEIKEANRWESIILKRSVRVVSSNAKFSIA